jgi:hypothetical protein
MKKIKNIFLLLVFFYFGINMNAGSKYLNSDHHFIAMNDDDDTRHPAGSFDYSHISSHPRLLFSEKDQKILKSNLTTNIDLAAVHKQILKTSNDFLNTAPVTRVMEGKRLLSVSRTALKRIFYLSYSYRMTGDVRYLNRAERELNAVCEFSDWNPSHFLDVGEMAFGVAIGYDWLFDKLKPTTKEKIRNAIISKAFLPSKDSRFNWFLSNNANWNQVCNTGLTFAALSIYEADKQEAVEIIERMLTSINIPLKEYAQNGNYLEGYMYWQYGTSFQVLLMAALESALGTDLNMHNKEGFMSTAEYMLFMEGNNSLCFNYSDSYERVNPNISMFWFAQKANNPSLLFLEKQKIALGGLYVMNFEEDRLLPAVMIFANHPIVQQQPEVPSQKLWVGYGKNPVAIIRDGDKYVGIKGGKAENSHGHMDSGSFVYEANGVRWAKDLGMQSYAPLEAKGIDLWNMGQNSERWDVFRLNNKSHNTLTINQKRHLVDGMANITKVYDTDTKKGVEVDLTNVFRNDVASAKRTVTLLSNSILEIEDVIATNSSQAQIEWRMVTPADIQIVGSDEAILHKNGKTLTMKIVSDAPVTIKTWSTAPSTNYDEPNPNTVIIGFESTLSSNDTFTFRVTLF